MVQSRVPAVLTQLTTVATTALASTTCLVFRGPFVTGDPSDALFIGYDGDPAGEMRAALVSSEWAGLGAKARNEEFRIPCAITSLRGDPDVKTATDGVYTYYGLFEAALRATPSLNQAPRLTASLSGSELFTMPHPNGLQVRLTFTVLVSARI